MLPKETWIYVLCLFLFDLAIRAGALPKVKVRHQRLMTSSVSVSYCPHPCICQLREAYCDGSSLDSIPLELPEDLTKVNLMDNHIKRVKKKHLGHLHQLKSLNFRRNEIEHLESGVFEHMNQLQALTFRENAIKRVNRMTFQGLNNLEFLSLRNNKLKSIEGAFQDLHHVKLLSLGDNKIIQLSSRTFSGNGRLHYLDLHNNSITFINKNAFVNLHMLKYLILRDNPIKLVDLNFKKNFHLELLDFTNCELQEMVQGLPTSIRDLRVAENNIKTLTPRDFSKTRKIRLLVLSENNLQYIYNDTFASLKFLDELEISNNSLTTIPRRLPPTLRKLSCANNSLTQITADDFHGNVNIEHLNLKQNQIHHVDMNAFKGMVKLKTLDLSRNHIDVLQPALFEKATKLELLDLSYNPITAVEHNCFLGLENLHILEMASVEAGSNFQPAIFKDTKHLLYLDLSNSTNVARHLAENPYFLNYISTVEDLNLMYNSLYSLPESFARNLPNLRSLKLIGNPWHCDNSIYWMTKWLKNNSVNFFEADHIVCASPPKLQGRRVDSLTLRELPTMAPPLVDFIPTIEIIEINFHHNESYRDNKHTKPSEPLKEFTYEQSEDFVAKHPKPTLPTNAFGKTSTEGQTPKKNMRPHKTISTTQLTTTTQERKQTTERKVSTQTITPERYTTVSQPREVTPSPTLKPVVSQVTSMTDTQAASTTITDSHTSQTRDIITTSISVSLDKSTTHLDTTYSKSQLTDRVTSPNTISVAVSQKITTHESTTHDVTTDRTQPHETTPVKSYTTTAQIAEASNVRTNEDTEQMSPETSVHVHTSSTQSTQTPVVSEFVSSPATDTQSTTTRRSPVPSISTTPSTNATQSHSTTTTQPTTTTFSTTQSTTHDSTTHSTTTEAPSTTIHEPTTTLSTTQSTSPTPPHTTTQSMSQFPSTTSTEPTTSMTTKRTTSKPLTDTKLAQNQTVHTPHTSTGKNVSTPKQHEKTRKDENEPTIARITIRRFTQVPPKIYWATTAHPPITAKPTEPETDQDLISETFIPYKGNDHGNTHPDQSRTYDIISNPDVSPNNNRQPFGSNDPFSQRRPFHRIRHQGHGYHRHRNHGKPHENKPFHGTQLWWSHDSSAGPFSSLHNKYFSNVRHSGKETTSEETRKFNSDVTNNERLERTHSYPRRTEDQTAEKDTHDITDTSDVTNYNWRHNAPWSNSRELGAVTDTRHHTAPWSNSREVGGAITDTVHHNTPWSNSRELSGDVTDNRDVTNDNRHHNAPWSNSPELGGASWENSRSHSVPSSNSRGHTYAFSSGDIDRAGSVDQEINDPSSGEYDTF